MTDQQIKIEIIDSFWGTGKLVEIASATGVELSQPEKTLKVVDGRQIFLLTVTAKDPEKFYMFGQKMALEYYLPIATQLHIGDGLENLLKSLKG